MKLLTIVLVVFTSAFALSISSCGGNNTSECSCEICINDVPAYPSDSEASCTQFMNEQDCTSYTYTTDPTQTCGGEDQPVCTVRGCSGQCQCPDEATSDIASDYDKCEELEE